jgi:hypothetical protein
MFTPPDRPRGSIGSWFRSSWLRPGPPCYGVMVVRDVGMRRSRGPRDHGTTGPSDLTLQLITSGGASHPAFARSFGAASRAPIPGRFARFGAASCIREVLECGSPLPLFGDVGANFGDRADPAHSNAPQSGAGAPQSKTLREVRGRGMCSAFLEVHGAGLRQGVHSWTHIVIASERRPPARRRCRTRSHRHQSLRRSLRRDLYRLPLKFEHRDEAPR